MNAEQKPCNESVPYPGQSTSTLSGSPRTPEQVIFSRRAAEWLSINEVHEVLGDARAADLQRVWRTLIHAAASGRAPTVDGVAFSVGIRRTNGRDRWCLHRGSLADVARACMPRGRQWPAGPEGWLSLEEAVVRVGPEIPATVLAQAWNALASGERLILVEGINPLDFRMQSQVDPPHERTLMYRDDVDALALTLKEKARPPRRSDGVMTPGQMLRRIEPDRHELALALLKLLGARARGGSVTLEGKRLRLTHFVVHGRSTPCLETSAFPHFAQCLDVAERALTSPSSGYGAP